MTATKWQAQVAGLTILATLVSGCQFLFEPVSEPRYRWVPYARAGGYWEVHPSGRYVWTGKEFHHVVSRADANTMSKRWRCND